MKDQSSSIHYKGVRQINFLNDLTKKNLGKSEQTLNFNSDRGTMNQIAQKLYKKIVRKGFIENSKDFAIHQNRKKIETMYDTSDKWIDDSEVITEPQAQTYQTQFSKFKAVSNIDIQEFYKTQNISKAVKQVAIKKKPSLMEEILKNPLSVQKFNKLKKKIKSSILLGDKPAITNNKKQ